MLKRKNFSKSQLNEVFQKVKNRPYDSKNPVVGDKDLTTIFNSVKEKN